MDSRSAWVLNLDADLELGASARYQPTKSVARAIATHAARFAAAMLAPGDVRVSDDTPAGSLRGLPGRAFCPTPRAVRALVRAGAHPEPYPPVAVLRRVNSRAFASALGQTLPGAAFVTAFADAAALLQTPPPLGERWRVKHAFGMAGRNQRTFEPARLDASAEAFVHAGLAAGGVQIEPNVVLEAEYAQHGLVAADGSLCLGLLVRQRCDARGVWVTSDPATLPPDPAGSSPAPARGIPPGGAPHEGAGAVLARVAAEVAQEARRVGTALARAGYFGPFGVDAFTYRDRAGALRLQPRSEINARYTMGFAVGFPSSVSTRVS